MELGIIGLGRMGANMTERLVLGGHRLISFDRSPEAIQRVVDKGALGAHSLADFVKQLSLSKLRSSNSISAKSLICGIKAAWCAPGYWNWRERFQQDPELASIKGYVEDSGEGRWTVEEAIERSVPVPVLMLSLFARFTSRQEDSFSAKVIAALRNEFGGHAVKKG